MQASLQSLGAPGQPMPPMTPLSPPVALLSPLIALTMPLAEANEPESASAAAGAQMSDCQSRVDSDYLQRHHSFDVSADETTAPDTGEMQPVASAAASDTASTSARRLPPSRSLQSPPSQLAALPLSNAPESAAATAQPPSENLVEILREQVRQLHRKNKRLAYEKALVEIYYCVRSNSLLLGNINTD